MTETNNINKKMKDNTTTLGYENLADFMQTNFATNTVKQNLFLTFFGGLSSFITTYIYNDAYSVYLLAILLFCDFFSGVCRAALLNKFSSARMPRIAATAIIYFGLLSLSWHISKSSPIYSFLPGAIYAVFVGTLFKSLVENTKDILPKSVYKKIMDLFKKK